MNKVFGILFLALVIVFTNGCAISNSIKGERAVASNELEVMSLNQLDEPVDIYLNTEYRGLYVADIGAVTRFVGIPGVLERDCYGSISIWFYKDDQGKLRYYSNSMKGNNSNCSLPKLGDMADLSQDGMNACAGVDFNYKVVDLSNIAYLREINFEKKHISAPVCDSPRPSPDVKLEYKDTLKLGHFRTSGANGSLHLQITMFKYLKMNYYLTPMVAGY